MSGAHHQKKLRAYEVTLRREVVFIRVLEVHARSAEEAVDSAIGTVDDDQAAWGIVHDVAMSGKAKVRR